MTDTMGRMHSDAQFAGMDEGIDFDTKTLVVIYNLMPQRVKDL